MRTWPHSGFHVRTAVWVPEEDRAFATRLARDCARNPVALERLTYDRAATAVTYRSDKSEGPTAGTETVDPLEFLARVLVHIPDNGHVTTRYYGGYAHRGQPPMGGAAAADLRGRSPRVPVRPRPREHHPTPRRRAGRAHRVAGTPPPVRRRSRGRLRERENHGRSEQREAGAADAVAASLVIPARGWYHRFTASPEKTNRYAFAVLS